jgi:MFS family permease
VPGSDPASTRSSWFSRNLLVLTLISFTQDAASELLFPLLPLLLTGALAAPPVVVGVIEGLADATAGLSRYVAGRWSDRRGRRPFIGAGYGLAAVGKVLVAAAGAWPLVLAGRVVDRFGKGVRSAPRDALIASSVPPELRARAFGFHRAGDTAGAVIGPLLGLAALAAMDGDLRAAMWWAVIPATLSALLVLAVREPAPTLPPVPRPARRGRRQPTPSTGDVAQEPLPRSFRVVTAVLVVAALCNFSDALILLRLHDLGFSTTGVVLTYVAFNLVYTVGAFPAGVVADRLAKADVYAVGLLAFAVGYVGLGLVDTKPAAVALVAVYGLFPALTDGVGKAWIASLVPVGELGRAQGAFQAATSVTVAFAGLWAGLLWDRGPGDGVLPLVVAGSGAAAIATGLLVARRAAWRR